jgi:tape measure domain-containing protein
MRGIQIPIGLDMGPLNRNLSQVRGTISGGLGRSLKGVGMMLGVGSAGLAGLLAIAAKRSITLAASQEQLAVAFETMLGSGEKAKTLLADIEALGAATPFQYEDLATAGKSLLAFGIGADDIVGTLSRLGDVASGLNIPIGDLAEIYGKARVQGRLFAEDINQLTGRGIPIIAQLAKQFGIAESEVKKLVESGRVGFGNLETAIEAMTNEGGQFFGMMQKQSQTLNGLISTLKDEFASLGREIGAAVIPELTDLVKFLSASVAEMRQFGLAADLDSIGRRMATGGTVLPAGPGAAAPSLPETRSMEQARLWETTLKSLDESVRRQTAKERAGAAPLGMPALRDLLQLAPAIMDEASSRAQKQLKDAVDILFDSPKKKKDISEAAAAPSDLRDVVNSDLVRIGGARGIGNLGDQGLDIQKSQDQKLGLIAASTKTTADALGKWAYA